MSRLSRTPIARRPVFAAALATVPAIETALYDPKVDKFVFQQLRFTECVVRVNLCPAKQRKEVAEARDHACASFQGYVDGPG